MQIVNPQYHMKRITVLLGACAALLTLAGCSAQPAATAPSLDEIFATRRSIRAYDADKKISEAEIRELLTATQNAPSWANQQPSKYYVALGQEKFNAVLDLVGGNKPRVANASALVVCTFEKGKSGFFRGTPANDAGDFWGAYDNGLSNAYFILKAREMGFDTLNYQSLDGMLEAIGIDRSKICTYCWNGKE